MAPPTLPTDICVISTPEYPAPANAASCELGDARKPVVYLPEMDAYVDANILASQPEHSFQPLPPGSLTLPTLLRGLPKTFLPAALTGGATVVGGAASLWQANNRLSQLSEWGDVLLPADEEALQLTADLLLVELREAGCPAELHDEILDRVMNDAELEDIWEFEGRMALDSGDQARLETLAVDFLSSELTTIYGMDVLDPNEQALESSEFVSPYENIPRWVLEIWLKRMLAMGNRDFHLEAILESMPEGSDPALSYREVAMPDGITASGDNTLPSAQLLDPADKAAWDEQTEEWVATMKAQAHRLALQVKRDHARAYFRAGYPSHRNLQQELDDIQQNIDWGLEDAIDGFRTRRSQLRQQLLDGADPASVSFQVRVPEASLWTPENREASRQVNRDANNFHFYFQPDAWTLGGFVFYLFMPETLMFRRDHPDLYSSLQSRIRAANAEAARQEGVSGVSIFYNDPVFMQELHRAYEIMSGYDAFLRVDTYDAETHQPNANDLTR